MISVKPSSFAAFRFRRIPDSCSNSSGHSDCSLRLYPSAHQTAGPSCPRLMIQREASRHLTQIAAGTEWRHSKHVHLLRMPLRIEKIRESVPPENARAIVGCSAKNSRSFAGTQSMEKLIVFINRSPSFHSNLVGLFVYYNSASHISQLLQFTGIPRPLLYHVELSVQKISAVKSKIRVFSFFDVCYIIN